ncbi:hypothetical protein ABTI69_19625, partial [Acinetobacter baumannii]
MRERAFSPDRVQFAWIWRAVWAACLLPLMLLVAGGLRDALGANPIEHITRATGDWTLRLDHGRSNDFMWLYGFTGHAPYNWPAPNGYPDTGLAWSG